MTRAVNFDLRVTSVPDMSDGYIDLIMDSIGEVSPDASIIRTRYTSKTYIFTVDGQMDGNKTLMDLMSIIEANFPMHRYVAINTEKHIVRTTESINHIDVRIKNS